MVVLHHSAQLTERDIKAYCSRKLDNYMMPRYIDIVDDLPEPRTARSISAG